MRMPALKYLKWRALGVPATTVLLVSNGIFRGRGDTTTPLYCTSAGNLVNILLDPILIFGCGMGVSGAGAATSFSQWFTALPLLYMLNKKVTTGTVPVSDTDTDTDTDADLSPLLTLTPIGWIRSCRQQHRQHHPTKRFPSRSMEI
jgi:Na+-driven multidrug efflux pump